MADIWEATPGAWYANDNGREYQFDTQAEAMQFMSKLNTAKAIVAAVQSLATATDSAGDLEAEYFDVGVWGDDDVAALGITHTDLAACITLLQQVNKLMTSQATAPAMYRTTLNKVRRVGV